MKPTICRMVVYRSRTGDYDVPAVITATQETLNPKGVEAFEASGGERGVPPLSSPYHVHLTVFTPGLPGQREGATNFLKEGAYGRAENVGGCYPEWDVSFAEAISEPEDEEERREWGEALAGTWRWPERV